MADGLRRSKKVVKVKEEPNFVYDTESINFLLNSVEGQGEIAHHRTGPSSDSHNSEVFNSACENLGYSAITTAHINLQHRLKIYLILVFAELSCAVNHV